MAKNSTKRKDSVLDLPSESDASNWGSSLIPYNARNQVGTRDERKIDEEYRKQVSVIQKQAAKTIFGQTKIAEINRHAAQTFDDTVGFIVTTKAEARGKEHQAYVDEFAIRQIQEFAHDMLGTIKVGATNIAMEIYRTSYVSASPPGFWERLRGES